MIEVKKSLVGQTFGLLTVIKQVDDYVTPNGYREPQWLCECSCEEHNRVIIPGNILKRNKTKSCGCLQNIVQTRQRKGNLYDISGEYGIIWSSNTNEEGYFDLEYADEILEHTWHVDTHGYFVSRVNGKLVKMHIFIGYKYHDHINHNKKDNRVENLRPCTHKQNDWNQPIQINNTSGYIGVCWNKSNQKWFARIKVNGKEKYLGNYTNKEDAIKARLKAENEYYGKFAPQKHLFEEYGIELINKN